MTQIPLTSGAYSAESYTSNAQRCVNLYPEKNPAETHPAFPTTHYVRPGLLGLAKPPIQGLGRSLYASTTGDLFAAIGQNIYYIDPNWKFTLLGQLVTNANTPVSMTDNRTTVVIVDGDPSGNQITLRSDGAYSPADYSQITDPNFVGSTRADFLDTFIILNKPGTNQWYCTLSGQVAFNGLFVGVKTAWPDDILCVVAIERQAWIFGPKKSEPWYNAGSTPFPFQLTPGVIIEQGCAARYSPQKMDAFVYWLSQSPEGARMAMRGTSNNVAQRISTHAIESEWLTYPRVDDAIGSAYQIKGHSFYGLHFPTADKTWMYDQATEQWWEDNSIDMNGALHRARNTFTAYAYGKNLGLDWATGQLYQIDQKTLTDDGKPIPWIRSFPHFANELKYVGQASIVADVETGTQPGTGENGQFLSPWSEGFSSGFGPVTQIEAPTLNLRISRDGGASYSRNRPKKRMSSGRYRSEMRWRGNGIARDWVLELSSTAEMCTALNGAYIDPIAGGA